MLITRGIHCTMDTARNWHCLGCRDDLQNRKRIINHYYRSGVQKSIIATEAVDKIRSSVWIIDIDMSVVDIDCRCTGVSNVDIDCRYISIHRQSVLILTINTDDRRFRLPFQPVKSSWKGHETKGHPEPGR